MTGMDRMRRISRVALAIVYCLAGILHIALPAPFLRITPSWVPFPDDVIFGTGICELLGAAGLLIPRVRRLAAWGLAIYAVAVYPANVKHAIDGLSAADATVLAWLYHIPRLALQPALVWLPLFAVGTVRWPFGR